MLDKKINSIKKLIKLKEIYNKKKVFLVTGRMSYKLSGAKETLSELLADEDVTHFPDFSLNPKLNEAIKGARLARCNKIEVIIAVGGGSVIDMAKLVKAFLNNPGSEQKIAQGEKSLSDPAVPLIVVPTTAGSGSEATHFAVVYIDDQKYSLASPHLQPNFVILDGSLIKSNSKYQKACNGLDALAQGIESAWAVNSSRESQKNALKAVKVCSQNLSKFVNGEFVLEVSNKMLTAANLSGQAINISKTTSAHAWSYGFTSYFGIPHGHAVWLTLPKIFQLHTELAQSLGKKCLQQNIADICKALGMKHSDKPEQYLINFCKSLGVNLDFQSIKGCNKQILKKLSREVNAERMSNNPILFDQKQINYIFELG